MLIPCMQKLGSRVDFVLSRTPAVLAGNNSHLQCKYKICSKSNFAGIAICHILVITSPSSYSLSLEVHAAIALSYWQQRVPSTSSTSLRSSVQPTRFSHEVTIAQILCCLPSVRIIVLRDDSSVSGHCSVCGCASDHRDFELLGLSPPPLNQYHAPV